MYLVYAVIVFIVGIATFYVKTVNSSTVAIEYDSPNTLLEIDKYSSLDTVTVHLAGAVVTPGVYKVKQGSRVIDVLHDYSNTLNNANLDKINLAKRVSDGQRIYIPTKEDTTNSSSKTPTNKQIININTATKKTLEKLPGVGKKTAQEIFLYRKKNGFFNNKSELLKVKYIGTKLLEKISPLISI